MTEIEKEIQTKSLKAAFDKVERDIEEAVVKREKDLLTAKKEKVGSDIISELKKGLAKSKKLLSLLIEYRSR